MNESKIISPPQEKKIVRSSSSPQKLEQNKRELIILTGITTSQINQAPKAKNPYPARVFLKVDEKYTSCRKVNTPCQSPLNKHTNCVDCAKEKCLKCDIPVFFRIREDNQ